LEQDVKQFVGKKVTLTRNLPKPNAEGHGTVEMEGFVIEADMKIGVLFRQRGRTNGELIKPHEVEDIRLLSTAPKPVKVKPLKRMNLETVRQHLADRHGTSTEVLNRTPEEEAMKLHDELHATQGSKLAHSHGDKVTIES